MVDVVVSTLCCDSGCVYETCLRLLLASRPAIVASGGVQTTGQCWAHIPCNARAVGYLLSHPLTLSTYESNKPQIEVE
jgi:hypothetical protein